MLSSPQVQFFKSYLHHKKKENDKMLRNIPDDWFTNVHFVQHFLNTVNDLKFCPNFICGDKYWVKLFILNGNNIVYIDHKFKEDKEIALIAYYSNPQDASDFFDEKFRDDEDCFHASLYKRQYARLLCFSERIRADKSCVIKALSIDAGDLEFVDFPLKDDEEVVATAVENNGKALEFASLRLKADKKTVLKAIAEDIGACCYCAPELLHDPEIIDQIIKSDYRGEYLHYLPLEVWEDPLRIEQVRKSSPYNLNFLPISIRDNGPVMEKFYPTMKDYLSFCSERLKEDREYVRNALANDFNNLEFASNELKDDEDLITPFLTKTPSWGFIHASERLKSKKPLALKAITYNTRIFKFLPEHLRKDEEIVTIAVTDYFSNIQYADYKFRNDKDFVLNALKTADRGGYILWHISRDLRADRDIVDRAITMNGNEIRFAHPKFLKDKKMVLKAIERGGALLNILDEEMLKDADILAKLVSNDQIENGSNYVQFYEDPIISKARITSIIGCLYNEINYNFMIDRAFIDKAFRSDTSFYKYLPLSLRSEKDIILMALQVSNEDILNYIPLSSLDEEIIEQICQKGFGSILRILPEIKFKRSYLLKLLSANGKALKYLSDEAKKDKELVSAAVESNGMMLKLADAKLKGDMDLIKKAYQENSDSIRYAEIPNEMRKMIEFFN